MEDFDTLLNKAITKCKPFYSKDDKFFDKIYPFSNENMNAYLKYFDLENKTLLTVGSSADQAINAHINNASVKTIIDICPYTRFYFNLKKSAIIALSYKEFLDFFCYYDYPKTFKYNNSVFNKKSFNKLKTVLKELDYESFIFWNSLFNRYSPLQVRKYLFSSDEEKVKILKHSCPYLENEKTYLETKKKIIKLLPKFIIDNIFLTTLTEKYDNIFLSNIAQYHDQNKLLVLLKYLNHYLNNDGQILTCYLFNTSKNTKYNKEWSPIFDLKANQKILGEFLTSFQSFQGIKGILFEDEKMEDSIMIYRKK